MKKPLIEIKDFKGGMTLNEDLGREDQFHIGYGLDFTSKPGRLTCGPDWTRMQYNASYDIPTQFNWILPTSNHNLYFGGEDGKIYKQTDLGTIDVAHTSTDTGAVKGMEEYKDYLYWAQNTTIGRYDLSSTWTDSWQTGLSDSTFHPMKVSADNKLYIGHRNLIASYDGTTFTSNALDLPSDWEVKCLEDFGYRYLAIGATLTTSSAAPIRTKIFLWDRTSSSWNDEIIIPENDIWAMRFVSGYLWILAGESSNIYVVPEASRRATKMWTFRKETQDNLIVYPGAVTHRRGTIYFALSDTNPTSDYASDVHSQNPTGIYSFPADPRYFTLNIPYKNQGVVEKFKSLAQVYWADNENLLYFSEYSWNGTAWETRLRREKTPANNENLYGTGVYESFRYQAPAEKEMFTEAFGVEFEPLPSGTRISLSYKKDGDTSWTDVFTDFQTDDATEKIVPLRIKAKSLKLRLVLYGDTGASSSNRPFIKRIFVTGHLIDRTY